MNSLRTWMTCVLMTAAAVALLVVGTNPAAPEPHQRKPTGPIIREVASPREVHHNAGVGIWRGRVYVVSGCDADGQRTRLVEVYDPAKNAWTEAAPAPSAHSGMATFVLEGALYCIGGENRTSGTFSSDVRRLDLNENIWQTRRRFPGACWDAMAVVAGGRAWVMGGRRGYGRTYADVHVYDAANEAWTKRADMPVSVVGAGVVAVKSKIYVFGGTYKSSESQDTPLRLLQIYDTQHDAWTTRKMPVTLMHPRAALIDGDAWLFSHLILDPQTRKWATCDRAFRYSPAEDTWWSYTLKLPEKSSLWNVPAPVEGRVYLTAILSPRAAVYEVDLRDAGEGLPVDESADEDQ